MLSTTTNTRINERILLTDQNLIKIVSEYPATARFKNFSDSFSHTTAPSLLHQAAFLHVVTETVYNYPVTFFSEKTAKPILNQRPFVIVGPVGSVHSLRSLGFKTFAQYWSEDYDSIADPGQRILEILKIIDWVCEHSVTELQSLCIAMQDILQYNYNHYTKNFQQDQLSRFEQSCIENLSRYSK